MYLSKMSYIIYYESKCFSEFNQFFLHTVESSKVFWCHKIFMEDTGGSMSYLATHTSLSPIRRGFAPGFVNCKKGCTRLAAASDKVYQLLVHCQWFFPSTRPSSTIKTGHHEIAEILLIVALSTKNQSINQSIQ